MGTIGDLVTLGVVGGIGYLVLKSGVLNNLGGGSAAAAAAKAATNKVIIPDYEELTPDQKKIVDETKEVEDDNVTKLLKDELKTANEQAITTAIETNTVLNNADKLIQFTPWSGLWNTIKEKSAEAATENQLKGQPNLEVETPKPSTKIDPVDGGNPIDAAAKNIGEGLKSAGLLGSDWKYTGLNLKFLGL